MSESLLPDPSRRPTDRSQKPIANGTVCWTIQDMLSWPISFAGYEASLGKYAALRSTRAPRSLFQPIDDK
jgi:hypothetical protein